MTKVVTAACLLIVGFLAAPLGLAKDATQLLLHKGARVGVINLMDPEVTHYHGSRTISQSFMKTHPVTWPVDAMFAEAISPRLAQLELLAVPLPPTVVLGRNLDQYFVENAPTKGLPKEVAKDLTQLAAAQHVDAFLILAPSVNNSAQGGGSVRKQLPDYLRGFGFVDKAPDSTGEVAERPSLFNMTQILLVGVGPDGVTLNAREWGGAYAEDWGDYVAPANPKEVPPEELDQLRPMFIHLLSRQSDRVLDWVTVTP
jgi:hypothetical protein